ncbi:HD domain-containing protein [Paenibacillus polymyxa]|uniref:HD domain-containing protein n=1 Tax=Paenibacillus polymyxa (strain SC2) TaxID=886882 RepID=E3EKB6_PAEPS|nr:HD domain-containing protein [Paenibacillus polymyxa]ADO59443.1 hypothetical protein PPSC2_27845 [Paenibacillus polymyxa SC2]WPQ59717.1 HD domain-containing protein [Paenibacillus polymyxa]
MKNLIKSLREPFTKQQMIPLLNMSNDVRQRLDNQISHFPTEEDIQEISNTYSINPAHLYVIDKTVPCYCYYDFPVYINIDVLSKEYFEMFDIRKKIDLIREESARAWKDKNYSCIFVFTNEQAKILLFNEMYWKVQNEDKFDLFQDVYTSLDYGHALVDSKIVRDVWQHQPEKYKKELRDHLDEQCSEDRMTIYRGESGGSTPYSESMSWTTSLNVACFFATRIRSDLKAKVYQAEVLKSDVLAYFSHRNEDEVVVFPEKLMALKEVPMALLSDEWEALQAEGYMDEYFLYKNTFINPEHYQNPEGIHGIPHVKRVLFHAITISRALGLSSRDRAILANASIYHDIGRMHDDHCTMHGEWSWQQYAREIAYEYPMLEINSVDKRKRGEASGYDIHKLSSQEVGIVRLLIEYHCRPDEECREALMRMYHFEYHCKSDEECSEALIRMHHLKQERERAWLLYRIFKDCDGLDRVRLPRNELDVKYFRTDEAVRRLVFAYQVHNNSSAL